MAGTAARGQHLYRTCKFPPYFPPADTLVDTLTVEEMLMYTALLKRPLSEPRESKVQEVDRLVTRLALQTCRWGVGWQKGRRGFSRPAGRWAAHLAEDGRAAR